MQFTFKELLEKHKVVIPQLQRDYAQGREKEADLRKGFISNIKATLMDEGKDLNLDFVYGYTEHSEKQTDVFIPLDGQQRLTTLWLLHWYLSPRIEEVREEEVFYFLDAQTKEYLQNFTYQTRISSKRFCECLISESLDIQGVELLSEKIADAPWYMASWDNDPTIKSILTMLDTLQNTIKERENAWNNLIQGRITFDYIDIKSKEFRLTDELYIKMNSRGKPLSDFENFKALFSGILAGKDTEYVDLKKPFQNTLISYQDYFAFKIDGQWLDLFWSYRTEVKISVDDCILNFLYYISEFLFYRYDGNDNIYGGEVPRRDIDFLAKIFSVKENIDFLFDALDFLSELKNVPDFFNSLFDTVSTFDNHNKDYFFRSITNVGFDVRDKIIFYALLGYATRVGVTLVDDNFRDYIRIVRNLLMAVRQPNPQKRIEYQSNLRLPNASDYCGFIDNFIAKAIASPSLSSYELLSNNDFTGFTRDSIASEKIKAEAITTHPNWKADIQTLEEHSQLQGNTINFDFTAANTKEKIEAFLQIWSQGTDRGLLVRALLCQGDYSVMTHHRCSIGPVWYFGSKGNWSRVLTATEKEERKKVAAALEKLLTAYILADGNTPNEKLGNIIENYKSDLRDWRYYFITYPLFTKNKHEKLNVFSWGDDDGYEISQLGNSGKQPLHSYHLSSYEIAVSNVFDANPRVILYYGRFTDLSYIKIDGKIRMESTRLGWQIFLESDANPEEALFEKYKLDNEGAIILKENTLQDRIQIAVSFINDLLASDF